MQYSPQASQPSSLTEEYRTLIQNMKMDWLGNLPLDESTSSLSILHSGIDCLVRLISSTVSATAVGEQVLNELDWSDGTVDVPAEVAAAMKKVIIDVIEEFGQDR